MIAQNWPLFYVLTDIYICHTLDLILCYVSLNVSLVKISTIRSQNFYLYDIGLKILLYVMIMVFDNLNNCMPIAFSDIYLPI